MGIDSGAPLSEGQYFVTRHTKKDKAGVGGVSEKGVELARSRANEFFETIKSAQPGTVMFMGGATEAIRTKTTLGIYADEIANLVQTENLTDIKVLKKAEIDQMAAEGRTNNPNFKLIDKLAEIISAEPDTKFVVDYPLILGGFSMVTTPYDEAKAGHEGGETGWMRPDGSLTEYTAKLLEKNNEDDEACLHEWLSTGGKMEIDGRVVEGPDPQKDAERMLNDLQRLKDFSDKLLPGRDKIIVAVGHSWDLDALAVLLTNDGKVTDEGYSRLGGMVKETEPIGIKIANDKMAVSYGDRDIDVPAEAETEE